MQTITKQCSRCKETKAVSEFHKNNRSLDGHHCFCKQCRGTKISSGINPNSSLGISEPYQINSVLRTIAECELNIDSARQILTDRIAKAKGEYVEMTEGHFARVHYLESVLKDFILKQGLDKQKYEFPFGNIYINAGKVRIVADVEQAKMRYDKP